MTKVREHDRKKPARPIAAYRTTLMLQQEEFQKRLRETEYLADELEKALAGETRETLQRMKETY